MTMFRIGHSRHASPDEVQDDIDTFIERPEFLIGTRTALAIAGYLAGGPGTNALAHLARTGEGNTGHLGAELLELQALADTEGDEAVGIREAGYMIAALDLWVADKEG